MFVSTQVYDWPPAPKQTGAEAAVPERLTIDDLWKAHGEVSLGAAAVILVPMLIGSGLLLGYIILRAYNVRVFPRCEFPAVTWDAWHLGRCAIFYVAVLRLVVGGVAWAQSAFGDAVPSTVLAAVAGNVVGIVGCLFIVALAGGGWGSRLGLLGLREKRAGSRAAMGVVAAIMIQPLLLVAGIITIVYGPIVGIDFRPQPLLFHARHLPSWGFALLCVSAVVVAPVTEEVLFRGFVYGTLRRYLGPLGAISLSAGIFSVLHGHPPAYLSLFVVGFLLAYLYERTGSLAASIAAHALHNLSSMLVVFVVYRG